MKTFEILLKIDGKPSKQWTLKAFDITYAYGIARSMYPLEQYPNSKIKVFEQYHSIICH